MKSVTNVVATAVMLALGAAGVGTYLAFRADMRAARARLLAGSRVLSTACGPIEVAEVGDGLPVLVVHGTGGGYDQGLNLARGLVGEGFRRIAVSRFSYLRTPMPLDCTQQTVLSAGTFPGRREKTSPTSWCRRSPTGRVGSSWTPGI
jgi:hypothetical protein